MLIDGSLRNKENYTEDLEQIKNGIKGKCIFNDLSYFNPVCSTNIDIMHSLFLGFIKTLFVYWFEHPTGNLYSLKSKIILINERLSNCRPPSYI